MRKKKVILIFSVIFLSFLAVMDYPFIARLINERNVDGIVYQYHSSLARYNDTEKEAMLKKAESYNERLASGNQSIEDAFQHESTTNIEYDTILKTDEEGVMGVVSIPKIKISLPIYHGTKEEVLQKGAGHVEGSSFPIGGKSTHACISAHRGLPNKKLFTSLDIMVVGDMFYIEVMGETLAYQVVHIETVLPEDVEKLNIEQGKDKVTLITCTPYGINTHRYYVQGERVTYTETAKQSEQSMESWLKDWWWIPVNIVFIGIMGIFIYRYQKAVK